MENSPIKTLRIFSSLSGSKDVFEPLKKGEVSFYVCGITAYDYCHIGHARAYVAFDTMRRYLDFLGYRVRYVQNFTDIDDKIIQRAATQNVDWKSLTQTFIGAYFEDMDALNVQRALAYPKATETIETMFAMISELIEGGHAYVLDGDVYFSVETFKDYGKLSKKVLEDLVAGARVEVSDKKKNPLDFALWKASKEGEPWWESPWGKGRPGWHIECSAMVKKELGETIDIHGGGEDLIFPHHENEIAQSECANHKPFAKYWIHNGFVTIRNDKMSKSKNNFVLLRDLLKDFDGDVIRFYLQKVHYRSPLHFSFDGIREAQQAYERLMTTLELVPVQTNEAPLPEFENQFMELMNDDFNFAGALGVLFDLSRHINTHKTGSATLVKLSRLLGLRFERKKTSLEETVQAMIDARIQARKEKNFAEADRIRKALIEEHRVELEDTPQGVRWKRV